MTREDGWFDFMVNGGGAVTLQFGKSPFPPKIETLFAPWNEVCYIEYIFIHIEAQVCQQMQDLHDTCWLASTVS